MRTGAGRESRSFIFGKQNEITPSREGIQGVGKLKLMEYKLSDIASICGGALHGEDVTVTSVITDSRARAACTDDGALFVAMRGAHHDGHDFIVEMKSRGARAFLTEHEIALSEGCGVVVVDNALEALQLWASHHRATYTGAVVGITGSGGKTVVKERLARLMPEAFRSPRSYNSQLGVALSLLMLKDEKVALIEAGISKPGEMDRLERMIRPDVVLVTSLGAAHQDNFASMEEKTGEKLLLSRDAKRVIFHGASAPQLRGHGFVDATDYVLPDGFSTDFFDRVNAQLIGMFMHEMGLPVPDFATDLERMPSPVHRSHTTVLEVDLEAMAGNLARLRSQLLPRTGVIAMVKASGYGTGDVSVARMLEAEGVDYLAVAFADEGVRLRAGGVTLPIVVLNADEDSFDVMVRHALEPEIYNFRSLEGFAASAEAAGACRYPIHVKLDTGMHRLGFLGSDIDTLTRRLRELGDRLRVATVFSHMAAADDPTQDDFTRMQIDLFERMSGQLEAGLGYGVKRHLANSAGVRFPEARYDFVRPGIGLYVGTSTLKTKIVQIKRLQKGDAVGYGREGRLSRDSVVATIPVGYADGLDRRLGCGNWSMLVCGHPAPTVGRICMDSAMIDITDIAEVSEGDEAVIFSPARGNTPEDMACVLGTINYEVLTSLSQRVKRVYWKR